MWLVVPLIYLLSWRTCRRFGQAFSETAAWIIGYLATAAVIMALNLGNIHIIEAKTFGTGSFVAMGGGFAGMIISRWLWKRRGGHLEPRKEVPWMRLIGRTFKAAGSAFSAPQSAAKPSAAATKRAPSAPQAAQPTAPTRPAASTNASARPVTPTKPKPNGAQAKPLVTSGDVQKVMSNKWVRGSIRGINAMLSDPKAKKTPRR